MNEKCGMKQRDSRLDALKMFLMICVIWGHVPLLDGFVDIGLPNNYDVLTWASVRGIYAFHMPLFVLLSGFFSRRKTVREQFRGSLKLLGLFAVFQTIDLLVQSFAYCTLPSLGRIVHPCFALWYLLCLFYWRMLISVIPGNWNPRWMVAASIAMSLAIGFTPIRGEMGLHRFFSFMPYFMIGHYYGRKVLQYIDNKIVAHFTPPPKNPYSNCVLGGVRVGSVQSALA